MTSDGTWRYDRTMTTSELPDLPYLVSTVLPEYGGDGITIHLPRRRAPLELDGPTVFVTMCGQYAHTVVRQFVPVPVTCEACAAAL